jgi:hypothetical protein
MAEFNYWWSEHLNLIDYPIINQPIYDFIKDLDLNQGGYVDVSASVSNSDLRVFGQKNTVKEEAHFWVQNKDYTWKNVMQVEDWVAISPQSGTITIDGFSADQQFQVQQWNTWTGEIVDAFNLNSNGSGEIKLSIDNLETDTAFKISSSPFPSPSPSPSPVPGDLNGDEIVDILDLVIVGSSFGLSPGDPGYDPRANADGSPDGEINILDLVVVGSNIT